VPLKKKLTKGAGMYRDEPLQTNYGLREKRKEKVGTPQGGAYNKIQENLNKTSMFVINKWFHP
jgi:hypothetical protein